MPINGPYNVSEHNISLGSISLSLLFSCLSWVEKSRNRYKNCRKTWLTTIVSRKYQAKRQDTESIDKRSFIFVAKIFFTDEILYD